MYVFFFGGGDPFNLDLDHHFVTFLPGVAVPSCNTSSWFG